MDPSPALRAIDEEANKLLAAIGEVLYIFRPVVYVTLWLRSANRSQDWHPFLISFTMDILSMRVSDIAQSPKPASSKCASVWECALDKFLQGADLNPHPEKANDLEFRKSQDELRRRKMLLALYLMRSPVFDRYTLAFARRLGSGVERLPVLGALGGIIGETLLYYHRNHFYISGS